MNRTSIPTATAASPAVRRRPSRTRTALGVALALGLGCSQAAYALDLSEAYVAARQFDAQVASARLNLQAISERVPQARAGLRPSVGASTSVNTGRVDTNVTDWTSYDNVQGGLSLSVPLYRPGNGVAIDQAQIGVRLAETQLAQAEQDLLTRVAQAYFDVLAAQDALEVAQAQRRAIAEQFEAARRNFEVGTATITDQQEAQARLDLNDAQLAAARNDLTVRRAALRTLTGVPAEALETLDRTAALPAPADARIEYWTDLARAGNYAVLQAQLASQLAAADIQRAKYAKYPVVDLVSQAGLVQGSTATGSPLVDRSKQLSAGIQLSVPLYAGGALDAREREAVAAQRRAEMDLENARRSAEQATRQVFLGLVSSLEQARALEAAERSSRLALESNLLGYQVGVRINVDVLNAQQQLFSTRRDLSRARYDVLVNSLRLQAATGRLGAEDVTRVNALLSPPSAGSALPTPSAPPPPILPSRRGDAVTKPVAPGARQRPAPAR
ncbi:MAG: TolC family outer membrane protein [Lautropia sp.]